jgi:integrase
MGRQINRLTALRVEKLRKPGLYPDGNGVYLQVTLGTDAQPRKSWLFRFRMQGRRERRMGLGAFPAVSLQQARDKASYARRLCQDGIDPVEARKAERAAGALAHSRNMTFDQCAKAYITAHRAGWRNVKHAAQWTTTLTTYASPVFGTLPVQAIDVGLVIKALERDDLWSTRPETASRVRGRIEAVLDWAKARGYRNGENPARWRSHLDHLLPARSKVRKVKHHAALNYRELGTFMAALRERETLAARALEFAILTAGRTNEVIPARWDEIDVGAKVWTVPAGRMKAGREHRVPLTDAALRILKRMQEVRQNEHVFPGERGAALSSTACLRLLRRMGHADLTVHGFRSTFRTWAAERTSQAREIAEAALAHVVGDATEQAYQRGDMFEKRRKLMDAWAAYCSKRPLSAEVIDLKTKVSV